MKKGTTPNTSFYSALVQLNKLFQIAGIKLRHFILPLFLGFLAALFEGISASSLIPLTRGLIGRDFSFVRETFIFKAIGFKFGQSLISSSLFVFSFLAGLVFVSTLVKSVLHYFSDLSIAYQLRKFSNRMRQAIFKRYLSFGKLFFDRTDLGHLNYKLTGNTTFIAQECMLLQEIFSMAFMSLVYIAIMFAISQKLTFIMIALLPTLNISLRWLKDKITKTSNAQIKANMILSRKILNKLSCLTLVKAYDTEKEEVEEFNKASDSVADWEYSMDKKGGLIKPIQDITMLIIIVFLLLLMAFIVKRGESYRISSFLIYFYILRRSEKGFLIPSKIKFLLARVSGPIEELMESFDDKDKFFVPEGEKLFGGLRQKIELKNLKFSYTKEIPVLKDINLSIVKNKITAVVGPTGSGKTTIINLIMRFYDCPPSTIFIDGIDIREFALKSLRGSIALVSQEAQLFNDTIRSNIVYGIKRPVEQEELMEIIKKARLYEFIKKLPQGLDTEIGTRGVRLSGGEKQRVSIARALLKNAEILILDEATSSLDTETELLIQKAIEEAIKNRTTIVIAHRLSTIKNADKVAVIEEGRLVEEGIFSELLNKKGKFHSYWQEQKFY